MTKTALVPVVLDPDAIDPDPAAPNGRATSGPDVPTPRPAEYTYDVNNTGTAPIRNVVLDDDTCDSPVLTAGDANGDNVLAVNEVWTYTCSTPLEREQATRPRCRTSRDWSPTRPPSPAPPSSLAIPARPRLKSATATPHRSS